MLEEELRSAAARASLNDVKALLKKGAKAEPDPSGRTPLHLAASSGHTEIVKSLVDQSTHINTTDSVGRTPLQIAAAAGHVEVIEVLLNNGANVNSRDTLHGNTALHEASWHGFSKTVNVLVKHKADTDLKNCAGFAPLHLCCQNGHNQSCRELLIAGANPNIQNNYGDTPLHTSARYGHAGVARILISATCHVSDQNKNGDTALHIAAAMGRRKLTSILLEAGCNQTVRNKQYETACDIATRKDLNEIIIILQSAKPSKSGKHHKKKSKKASDTSDSDKRSKEHIPSKDDKKNMEHVEWSPYGCHYAPDPDSFPQPKLDSLPGEPLNKGEQYYLDLAGNIRKGPVGVGLTCYCTNFLRDMEARLEKSNIELKHKIKMTRCRLEQRVERTEGLLAEYIGEEKVKRHSTEGSRGRTPDVDGRRRMKNRSHSLDLLQNCTDLRKSTPEQSSIAHSHTPELPPIDLSLFNEDDLRKLNSLSLQEKKDDEEIVGHWEDANEPYSEIHKLPYRTRTAVYSPTYDSLPTQEDALDPTCSTYVPQHLSDKVSNSNVNVFDGHNVTI